MDSLRGNKGYVHTADKGGPLCDSSDFLKQHTYFSFFKSDPGHLYVVMNWMCTCCFALRLYSKQS